MNRCLTKPYLFIAALCASCLFASSAVVAGSPYASPYASPYGPGVPPAAHRVGPGGPGVASQQRRAQIRMTQERTDDLYLLIIDLEGLPPENVQVRPMGQSLLVRTRVDARSRRSERYGDGSGYRESYRFSSGSSTRRLPVPPDGDLFALAREDSAEQVRILIPRRGLNDGR